MVKLKEMKTFFKKFILTIVMCLSFVGCDLLFKTPRNDNNQTYGATGMKASYEMVATAWQVDSICKADTLPNLDAWIFSTFNDYETGEIIYKRMYVKEGGEKEIIYIIMGDKEPYKVTRRITE